MTLYDKSFVEMLNVDQSVLFDLLYSTVLAPIFYIEVLADLEKENPNGRAREKVVSDLVNKTPIYHTYANVAHTTLCELELLGFPLELRNVPAMHTGKPFLHKGKVSIVSERSPEQEAFHRWQHHEFGAIERDFATRWRATLKAIDHVALSELVRRELEIEETPKNLEQTMTIARNVLSRPGQHWLNLKRGYEFLGLDPQFFPKVADRWKRLGHRSLTDHAPFTAHCLLVDLFFHIAVGKRLISPDRPSNKTDMAYLYYLPFTQFFVSNDKLHHRVAPLFMSAEQQMITGADLKADLMSLDEYYSRLPDEQKQRGMFKLAQRPPDDDKYLTSRLWRSVGFDLSPPPEVPRQVPKEVLDMRTDIKSMVALSRRASRTPVSLSTSHDADKMVIERRVPRTRGKWQVIPPDVGSP